MEKPGAVKIWAAQIRANFLILAVFLTAIGLTLAGKQLSEMGMTFNGFHAILLLIGVVSAHISVNLFNEYSDNKTGIDAHTQRTPFSGGSGMLQAGFTTPKKVLIAASAALIISLIIGIYFTIVSHWIIIIIAVIGGFAIVFYTNFLAKFLIGELFAGLALGSLVVIGVYISMFAAPGIPIKYLLPLEVVLVAIPPGILTALLLLLNEFPDAEVDKQGGRNHLVIKLGKKKAAYVYSFGLFLVFAIILILPILNVTSWWILIALLPVPLAIKASLTAVKFGEDTQNLIPALGINVMIVLGTDLLLAVSYIIDILS